MMAAPPGLPNIAFMGKAGSGKSTATQFLTEHNRYRKLSFADHIVYMCELFGWPADREHRQKVGQFARSVDPDAWVKRLMAVLDQWQAPPAVPPTCVEDCRFPNEYDALAARGFVFVRVVAPLDHRIARLTANGKWQNREQLDHESETALDHIDADYTVENLGDPMDLYSDLLDIVSKEMRKR